MLLLIYQITSSDRTATFEQIKSLSLKLYFAGRTILLTVFNHVMPIIITHSFVDLPNYDIYPTLTTILT
jgi:hypothetical protein